MVVSQGDNYKRWAIQQTINELLKKLKRLATDSAEYTKTALRIEDLKKDLES
jgi:hypothetical protein